MRPESKLNRWISGTVALLAAAVLLVADQVTKHLVLEKIKPTGALEVIPGLLEFSYIENTGAAFGMFKDSIWIISVIGAAATVAIILLIFKYSRHTVYSLISAALLLAGGIGNIIDRIRFGFVVDFIFVKFFPYIFNFADCCITVGTGFFILHFLILTHREKAAARSESDREETDK